MTFGTVTRLRVGAYPFRMKLLAIGLGLALGACADEPTVQAVPTRPWSPAGGILVPSSPAPGTGL